MNICFSPGSYEPAPFFSVRCVNSLRVRARGFFYSPDHRKKKKEGRKFFNRNTFPPWRFYRCRVVLLPAPPPLPPFFSKNEFTLRLPLFVRTTFLTRSRVSFAPSEVVFSKNEKKRWRRRKCVTNVPPSPPPCHWPRGKTRL